MNHGRVRELEWQRDDLWHRLGELLVTELAQDERAARWYALLEELEAAEKELRAAL